MSDIDRCDGRFERLETRGENAAAGPVSTLKPGLSDGPAEKLK